MNEGMNDGAMYLQQNPSFCQEVVKGALRNLQAGRIAVLWKIVCKSIIRAE